MDCQEASILMMECIDETIRDIDREKLMEHIEICDECGEEFSLMLEGIDLVEGMEDLEPPEELEDLVMESIDIKKYSSKVVNRNIIAMILTVMAVMGVTTIGIAIYKMEFLKEVFISTIINIVNFAVLTLPKVVGFVENNIFLIAGVGVFILLAIMAALFLIAVAQVYLIRTMKLDFRRG